MENEPFHNQDCSICLLYGYLDSSYVHLFVTYYPGVLSHGHMF